MQFIKKVVRLPSKNLLINLQREGFALVKSPEEQTLHSLFIASKTFFSRDISYKNQFERRIHSNDGYVAFGRET